MMSVFWRTVWRDVEPVVVHAAVVAVVVVCIAVVSFLLELLPFPEEAHRILRWVEAWLGLAFLSIFGVYAFVQVGRRLFNNLREDPGSESPNND